MLVSGVFSRKIKGSKRLNLPSIFEETRVTDNYLEISVDYTYFSGEKCTEKLRLKQQSDFLIKNRVLGLWFHYLCLEIADWKEPGRTLHPPLGFLISTTAADIY